MEDLLVNDEAGRRTITINRPEKLNALRRQTFDELLEILTQTARFEEIRVVVITGAGGRAFSVGGDRDEFTELDAYAMREFLFNLMRVSEAMRALPQPIIARVDGWCLAGGNEVLLHCDLAAASDRSTFGQAGPTVGVFPVWGGTQLLPLHVNDKRAREVVLLCEQHPAERALSWGWINRVVPVEDLDDEVQRMCDRIIELSPRALAMAKSNMNQLPDMVYSGYRQGMEMQASLWNNPETLERFAAIRQERRARRTEDA